MRVYEFAEKQAVTCAAVLEAAKTHDIEIYSPLSRMDESECRELAGVLATMSAEAKAAFDAKRSTAAEAKRKRLAELSSKRNANEKTVLEEHRRRAIEAAGMKTEQAKTEKKLSQKQQKPAEEIARAKALEEALKTNRTIATSSGINEIKAAMEEREKTTQENHAATPAKPEPPKPLIKIAVATKEPPAPKKEKDAPKKDKRKIFRQAEDDDEDPRAAAFLHGSKSSFQPLHGSRSRTNENQRGAMQKRPAQNAKPSEPPPSPVITTSVANREIQLRSAILVKELATRLNIRPNRLIADLMELKVLASINQHVEADVAAKIAAKYGYTVTTAPARNTERKPVLKAIDADDAIPDDRPDQLIPRPPVVTFLGHVDHGKTTLMDYIRKSHVAAGEAGGITQQISAYQVEANGRKITFIDTPGHAAFSAMRQRGASLTDIAVIIVAADDGIMPQTKEAIADARQAGVQMMVAITKCDLKTANPERVKQMLQGQGLTPEDWGGDIVCCEVSGVTGKGVDNLLEMILLQADMLELAANPNRRANGYVIEAELEQGFGPSATLLVSGGTLKVGDAILVGEHFGKVRSLIDDRGRRVREAPPATPIKCSGLSGVPEAGAEFRVMPNEKRARALAEEAAQKRKLENLNAARTSSLDDLMSQMKNGEKKELNIILKSDTQGSLEAVSGMLRGIKSDKVSLNIIGTATGSVSLTDVSNAAAGKAIIVGFDIGSDSGVQQQARHDGVRINTFRIVYELEDFVKKSMLDLIPPEYDEIIKGHAEIKAIYDISKMGKIAGSQMRDGSLLANAKFRVLRNGETIWTGKLHSLRHFKDEVKEVSGQQECGVAFENFEKFHPGDIIECFILEEKPRSL